MYCPGPGILYLSACLKTRQCARHVTRRARPRGSHSREQWPGVSESSATTTRAPSPHSHCEHPKEQPWRSFFLSLYLGHRRVKMFFVRRLPGSGAPLCTDTRTEAPGPATKRPSWSGLITLITRTRPDAKNDLRNKLRIFSNSQFGTFLFSELNLGPGDPCLVAPITCKLPHSFWLNKTNICVILELFSVACWHYWHWHLMLDHLPRLSKDHGYNIPQIIGPVISLQSVLVCQDHWSLITHFNYSFREATTMSRLCSRVSILWWLMTGDHVTEWL